MGDFMKFDYYVVINLTIAVMCLIFLLVTFVTYFSKSNMNNIENTIYRHMLIANALCVIFYIIAYSSCIIFLNNYDIEYFCVLLLKLAPMFLGLWCLLIIFYVFYITNENNKKVNTFLVNNHKKILGVIYFIICVVAISTYFENISFDYLTGIEKDSFIAMSILIYFGYFLSFVFAIYGIRKVSRKKALPLYLIIGISFLAVGFGVFNVPIIVMFAMMTLINLVMYHTIENPDMKMVAELTLAKDTAEKASKAKSEFLSSMSHELKTPLNAILGFSNVIKDSSDIDNIHSDIDEVINSSNKLLDMVDSILNVNQLDNNNLDIVNNKYNITDIVLNINDNMDYRIKEKNLSYTFNISNNVPKTLFGDSNKIKTIITNLLSNAVKYTDEGAINLDINCLNNKDDCNLTITVSDTGRGINDAQRESLFEKFNRLDEDRDSDIEGTGLGLNITKSLVDLLEGDISVSSIPGEGSTFTVKLKQKIFNEEIII